MNDETLRKKLQELATPPVEDSAREKALHRAQIAFLQGPSEELSKNPLKSRWTPAFVAVVLLGLLWFAIPHGGMESLSLSNISILSSHSHDVGESQPSAKLLMEMEALFPGQIDAVILQGKDVKLDLSDAPERDSQQPLVVTLRRGDQTVQVLAYSGRKVCVELGGHRECFEPLVTADGNVILSGDDFVWDEKSARRVAGYSVQARSLSL